MFPEIPPIIVVDLADEPGTSSVQPVAVQPETTCHLSANTKVRATKRMVTRKKAGRRADKTFGSKNPKTTAKGSTEKNAMTATANMKAPLTLKWINTSTSKITVTDPAVSYLAKLAAHEAVEDPEYLLAAVEALLRQGAWELAFMDDSLPSIIQRCHRATHVCSAAEFLSMVQYLQLVFKVSRYVLDDLRY